mmetsp:Transcript_4209/g.7844  ORF Transcript_4209/g.7844 Transcript_4209/m.7844 type:complete len:284 (-) Transcript_4209:69-920(-)
MKRSADLAGLDPSLVSRVFVGSLAFSTTWYGLKDHFKTAGDIEFASVLKTPQGQSKGCGMVDYKTPEEAQQAVALLDGSSLDGRVIQVKLDIEGKRRQTELRQAGIGSIMGAPKAFGEDQSFFQVNSQHVKRVFVGNLAWQTNWQSLKDHFTTVAPVELASVLLKPDRTSKGCGMVNFLTHEDAVMAVDSLHDSILDGRKISVKLDTDGWFKAKPEPGARPPVFQMQMKGGGKGGHFQASPRQGFKGGRHLPAQQALNNLAEMASMPGANRFDWPSMIRQMSR